MAAVLIGLCACPLCGSKRAKLTLAKSGLPVLTCNACNSQSFARSDRSDMLMRERLVPAEKPAADPVREPAAPDPVQPKPAPQLGGPRAAPVRTAPAPDPVPPAPAPAPASSWGFESWK